jgi:phage-related minor tail protein
MDVTVGQAFTNIGTSLTDFFGKLGQATGVTNLLANAFNNMAKGIKNSADNLIDLEDASSITLKRLEKSIEAQIDNLTAGKGFAEGERLTGRRLFLNNRLLEIRANLLRQLSDEQANANERGFFNRQLAQLKAASKETDTLSKKEQTLIDKLKVKIGNLSKNSREQAIANNLLRAGTDITTDAGKQIAALTVTLIKGEQEKASAIELTNIATKKAVELEKARADASERAQDILKDRAQKAFEIFEAARPLEERQADVRRKLIGLTEELTLHTGNETESRRILTAEIAKQNRELEKNAQVSLGLREGLFGGLAADNRRRDAEINLDLDKTISPETRIESLRRLDRQLSGLSTAATDYQDALANLNKFTTDAEKKTDAFARKQRELRLAFLETETTVVAGAERAFLNLTNEVTDVGAQVEKTFMDAFDSAGDALVDFVQTGKVNMNSFVKDISAQLIRLGTKQAFAAIGGQLFPAAKPGASGGGFNIGSFLGNLLPFQNGGSFTVGANSAVAALPGIDNRLVAFRARDQEKVTITPKGRSASGGSPVNQIFNIQTRDADSFRRSQTQIQNRALAGLDQARVRR